MHIRKQTVSCLKIAYQYTTDYDTFACLYNAEAHILLIMRGLYRYILAYSALAPTGPGTNKEI